MATVHPTINDQITRVQLRLLKQKLENEQDRLHRTTENDRNNHMSDNYNRLEAAISRRQELLDRLEQERRLSEELTRPSTLPRPHHQQPTTGQLLQSHRRSESQPLLYENMRRPNRYLPPLTTGDDQRQVATLPHQPLSYQHHLPAAVLPPIVQPQYMVTTAAPQSHSANNQSRTDMYEMLMIQNAQMHQMIMQQLMLSTVSRPAPPAAAAATEANNDDTLVSIDIKDLIDLKKSNSDQVDDEAGPRPMSVHYHHYGPVPDNIGHHHHQQQQQPDTAQVYTLPPIQVMPEGRPYVAEDPQLAGQFSSQLHRKYHQQKQHQQQQPQLEDENSQHQT